MFLSPLSTHVRLISRLALSALLLGLLGTPAAFAQSTSENSVDLTFTLTSAIFEATGLPADDELDFQIVVDAFSTQVMFTTGDGVRTGTTTWEVDGVPWVPDPNEDTPLTVGGTLQSLQVGTAAATSLSSAATAGTENVWSLDIANESLENIQLNFSWNYTRTFRLENAVAGNQTAAFLDNITAFIDDGEGLEDTQVLVEDQNFGNFQATVVQQTILDSGTFTLLVNAEDSQFAFSTLTSRVVNNVIINVAQPVPVLPGAWLGPFALGLFAITAFAMSHFHLR